MSLAGGWILAPLVLALVLAGLGLLAERAARVRLPGALVAPVGLAALIALAGVPATFDATAELAVPLVAVCALAGLVLAHPWRDPRLRAAWPWPLLAAAGAFAVYAAPSLLTGQGSIAGYVKLDDSATWLALTDHVLERGRDLSGLPPSSHTATLQSWLEGGYPVGAFLPLGVAAGLSGQDLVNAYQPTIALLAAVAALGFFAVAHSLTSSRAAAAAAALVAVQASLLLGYAQWGGIKEVATVALLPPLAALALRSPLLLAIAVAAIGGTYGINGMAWGAPALALGAAVALRGRTRARALAPAAAVLAAGLVPVIATLRFAEHTTIGAIARQAELGNLIAPLPLLQGAGLWPVGDFRITPDPRLVAVVLALACAVAAAGALAVAVRRRAWDWPALAAVTVAGVVPALVVGSPWVDAKALAILSGISLLGASCLVAAGLAGRGRAAAGVAGAVLLAATAWSTGLIVRDVQIAPRERLAELRALAARVAGEGPLVLTDYEIYGSRHLLREAEAEGATDLRVRPVARRDGTTFPELGSAEVDEMATDALWVYRTLVRRRSPVASRPPAAFRRIWAGRHWEAWQRAPEAPAPLARLPLGTAVAPAAAPECAAVRALAETPEAAVLAAAPRTPPVVVSPAGEDTSVPVPSEGSWRVWVGGSLRRTLEVSVDGRSVGSLRHEIAHNGHWLRFGTLDLTAGEHVVTLSVRRGLPAGVGADAAQSGLAPLALTPAEADGPGPVVRVAVRDWRRLCDGRTYDWVEALPAGA